MTARSRNPRPSGRGGSQDGDDHTEEARYTQWRLRDEGKWLLHGHTHIADQRQRGYQVHVGLDAWDLTPVPLGTIEKFIKGDM